MTFMFYMPLGSRRLFYVFQKNELPYKNMVSIPSFIQKQFMSDFFHSLFSSEGLRQIITNGGVPLMCLIIFAETGLLIGFFLPGDTLLFLAGSLSATGEIQISIFILIILLTVSAIIGNSVGYFIGAEAGKKLFERPNSHLFKKEHL